MMSWILFTWINYEVLEWVGPGSRKALASKVGTSDVYLCVAIIIFSYVNEVDLCQCIIPWGL